LRIIEPFVKVSYALWLVSKGANNIIVSVDGAEPEPETVARRLGSKGYRREPLKGSRVEWTGVFSKGEVQITVISHSGIDIKAYFPNERLIVAECKGEPTPKGIKSGLDLTALYTALGQLIITADDEGKSPSRLVLVMPAISRLIARATKTAQNTRFKKLDIGLSLVDEFSNITEITPNLD